MDTVDIRELRGKILLAGRRGQRIDGGHPPTVVGALVRNVLASSEISGLSGEDTMTWLAFEALKALEEVLGIEMQRAMREPAPRVIVPKDTAL